MKFFQTKKYSILSKVLKYSFVGVIAIMIILPTLFLKAEAEAPGIVLFEPTEGVAGTEGIKGTEIRILGDFSDATSVFFNTTKAVIQTNIPALTVTVPVGATDGPIQVITPRGSSTSASNFKVIQPVTTTPTTTNPANTTPASVTKKTIEWGKGGLVPICNTGVIDPVTKNYAVACDFDMLLAIINKVISFLLVTLATPLFALIIIYTGWLYLSSMGSPENITKAKKIFKNAFIGYVIALAAWLIVKTILTSLGYSGEMYLSLLLINFV
ncbi:MAG: hypothetical protein JJE53_01950 [Candidatus Pacebacteria bacterium]|nr:hypothetical protein [Candidatus Paceibacterota bacterium]